MLFPFSVKFTLLLFYIFKYPFSHTNFTIMALSKMENYFLSHINTLILMIVFYLLDILLLLFLC